MGITALIAELGTRVIGSIGYAGVFLLMVAESMILPVPSEAVMPFAGFLVADQALAPVQVVAFATLGSVVGSLIGYAIGWGTTIPNEPYVPEVKSGDWKQILALEAEWKKSKGYT